MTSPINSGEPSAEQLLRQTDPKLVQWWHSGRASWKVGAVVSDEVSFEAQAGWVWIAVFGIIGLGFAAMVFYAYYENRRLDAQEPVVETCVHHRLSQKVVVQ